MDWLESGQRVLLSYLKVRGVTDPAEQQAESSVYSIVIVVLRRGKNEKNSMGFYDKYVSFHGKLRKRKTENMNQTIEENGDNSGQVTEDKTYIDTRKEEKIDFDEDMIINFDDALGEFEIPSDVSREVVLGEYSENFLVELQEILVHHYDVVDEENDNEWQRYEADCEIITLETCGDIPFEDIVKAAKIYSSIDKISMRIADIDRDGRDEYVINDSIGRGQLGCIYVVKYVDEKWTLIGGGNARYSTDVCGLLEYKDRYYLLVGEKLSYWRDEVEIPDGQYWGYWDSAPWQADVWNLLEIEKEITGYNPYETYSYLQVDSIDYLLDMNLISLEDNCSDEENFEVQHWSINGKTTWPEYGWKREYAGENYFYVVSAVDEECDDMLLTVICEKGDKKLIVKVYYLSANYNIWLRED